MHALGLLLFSIAAGFTASAIIANIYRICAGKVESSGARAVRVAVLVFAGPSVIFDNAVRGLKAKTWHPFSFWLVTAGVLYWSFALGLLVLEIVVAL
jgi:hypothetical protein